MSHRTRSEKALLGVAEFSGRVSSSSSLEGYDEESYDDGSLLNASVNESDLANNYQTLGNSFISFVGAGVLGLPFAFKQAGLLAGTIGLLLVAAVALHCTLLIVNCKRTLQQRHGKLVTTYTQIGTYAMGSVGSAMVSISLCVAHVGFTIAYLIFISHNLHHVYPRISINTYVALCIPGHALLSFVRNLKTLSFCSIIADLSNLIGFSVVYYFDFTEPEGAVFSTVKLSTLPVFMGIVCFAFEGIGMVISIENSTRDKELFPSVWKLNVALVTLLYWSFGFFGYMAYGEDTNGIITLNMPPSTLTNIVKVALCIGLYFTYNVMLFPVLEILENSLFAGQPDRGIGAIKRNVFRCLLVVFTVFTAVVMPSFELFLSLIGSSCCSMLAFIMPTLFHNYICYDTKTRRERIRDWCICFFGVGVGLLGTFLSVRDIFEHIAEGDSHHEHVHGPHDDINHGHLLL